MSRCLSVTRFGEIWKSNTNDVRFSIWPIFEPTLTNFYAIPVNCTCWKNNKTICSHWVRCSSRTIQFQPNWIIWWWLPRWFFNIELYSWLSIDWITVHAENTHLLCKGEYHCSPEGLPWYCMEPTKAEKSIVNFHVVKLAVTLETSRHRGMVLLPMVNALCRGALW